MVRRRPLLTDAKISKLKPGSTDITIGDAGHPGLYVRVTPKGHKSYVLRYTRAGKQRKHTVGDTRFMTIDEAREAARDFLAKVKTGANPKASDGISAALTVAGLAEEFLKAKMAKAARGKMRVLKSLEHSS